MIAVESGSVDYCGGRVAMAREITGSVDFYGGEAVMAREIIVLAMVFSRSAQICRKE